MMSVSDKRQGLMLLCLVVLVCLVYANTLGVPFYFDDIANIEKNPYIRLTELTFSDLIDAGFESLASNRPIANISFALNYYFHRYNVGGYHIVNIVIHIATGILLYLFLKTILSLPLLHSKYNFHSSIAFYTALIWLVHPIQTQSVTYIVQRMNSMAAMFYVLSLLFYAKGRLSEENKARWLQFAGCVLAGILAIGCKEIAATLPLFIFLYEWYFFQDLSRQWLKRHALFALGILVLFGFLFLLYTGANPLKPIWSTYAHRDFTLSERLLTQPRVVIYYISLLFYPNPSRLALLHDFPISHSLIDPITTLLSTGAIIVLLALAIYTAKRQRLLSFCILWFFGNLVMESSIIGLEIIYEHRTYLPGMLFFLVMTVLIHRYINAPPLKTLILASVVLALSLYTYERNTVWNRPLTFWQDAVRKSPRNARAHNNLARSYIEKKSYLPALTNLKEALRLNPNLIEAYENMAAVYIQQGLYDSAVETCRKALKLDPRHGVITYKNLGIALKEQGNLLAAIDTHLKASKMMPTDSELYNCLGSDYLAQGQIDLAIDTFRKGLRWHPHSHKSYNNLGQAYAKKQDLTKAVDMFRRAVAIRPNDADANFNLARAYELTGQHEAAIAQYDRAAYLNSKDIGAYHNAGIVCLNHLKDKKRAIAYFKKALSLDSAYPGSKEVKVIINESDNRGNEQ